MPNDDDRVRFTPVLITWKGITCTSSRGASVHVHRLVGCDPKLR